MHACVEKHGDVAAIGLEKPPPDVGRAGVEEFEVVLKAPNFSVFDR